METLTLGSTTTRPVPPPFVQRFSETTRLRAEIMRLRVENEDLRASAEWWLYL